jgi:ABC-type transporter Mla subunit MlaD
VNEQGIRFRIGVFVLTAMILLAVLIILFGRFPNFLKGTSKRYYVVFDYAPGVAINTPVRRSGVRIGQVEKVELDDASGKVRVTILIDPPHVLYEDDHPRLVRGALSGDTSIDFEPPARIGNGTHAPEGRSEEPPEIKRVSFLLAQQQPPGNAPPANPPPTERKPAPPGSTFQGASQSDVSSLISELNKLAPPAREAFIEMQKTLERYERMSPVFEDTLREFRDLAKALREITPDVREFVKTTRDAMPDLRRAANEVEVTARNWGRLG